MAKVNIAVFGATPGQGATTVCLNVAAALAGMGKAVLMVDADPDGAFEHMPGLSEFGSALDREGRLVARTTAIPRLSALPRFGAALRAGAGADAFERAAIYGKFLDFAVFDAPSGRDADKTLGHVDLVFLVSRPEVNALAEMPAALSWVLEARGRTGRPKFGGVIVNMSADSGDPDELAARSAISQIREAFPDAVLREAVPRSESLARSRRELSPVLGSLPADRPITDVFNSLAQDILKRAGESGAAPSPSAAIAGANPTTPSTRPAGRGLLGWILGKR